MQPERDASGVQSVWLVTFATYRRRPVFGNPELQQTCAAALRETIERNGYRVYALAIMPDHVHAVVDSGSSGHGVSRVLNNLKGVTARRLFQASPELREDLRSDHLWADEYQAVVLEGRLALTRACHYVATNPIVIGESHQHYSWLEPGRPADNAANLASNEC